MRKVFISTGKQVTKDWARLHKEELHNLYFPPNFSNDQIKKKARGGACNTYGGEGRCIQAFGGGTSETETT